jgi:hypothetical protein
MFNDFDKTNTIDPKRLHPFLAPFGRILRHSCPAPIYSVFKLTTALTDLKLMPVRVFADILQHILSFPKVLDWRYSLLTIPLFK